MQDSARQQFLGRLESSFSDGLFVKLTLGRPAASESALRKLLFRPVLIRGEKQCSVVSRFTTRDETANHPFREALALVERKLGTEFLSANLFTESGEVQIEVGKKERLRVTPGKRNPANLEHDRTRVRWVDSHARYLHALNVTDAHGKVRERMGDKFRQIERFVDLLASAFRESNLVKRTATADFPPITLHDMGSGKGYLTFAAYDYFRRVEKLEAVVTGVELRDDLVALCNKVALDCEFAGLRFVGTAISENQLPAPDILLALHACDTATDDALFAGVRAGAEIMLVAPCCHKEARPQIDRAGRGGQLRDVLRHGVFAERHAEMATDALRALLLERAGYVVRMSEFVAAEHTAKNVMLIATRRRQPEPDARADIDLRIAGLKALYGIEHHRLEHLLLG
jgi:hypothetical protein